LRRDAKEVNIGDFFAAHIDAGKWRGKQVAITPDGCALLEFYNTTLFQQAGLAAPKPTWTWNDYLDVGRQLTKKDASGQVTQAGILPPAFGSADVQPWIWLWSNGADLLSDDFKKARIDEPQAIEAVQFAVDLIQKHGITSSSPGVNLGANPHVAGKVAMWRTNRGFFGNLVDVNAFKFNVVPVARSPRTARSITVTTPGHIAIAASNKHPDAAFEWHKYITGTEAEVIASKLQATGCPSRKSATQDASYMSYGVPALESFDANKAFFDVLSDPKLVRFAPEYVGMTDALAIFNKYALAASQGQQAVPAAMTAAKAEIDDLLRRKPQPQ
jgi:ABC-type glycerol-3-phosphate transport system substrate-binding protein